MTTRVHGVVEHAALPRRKLAEAGLEEEAVRLSELVRRLRVQLDLLDEAYIQARYGSPTLFGSERGMQ